MLYFSVSLRSLSPPISSHDVSGIVVNPSRLLDGYTLSTAYTKSSNSTYSCSKSGSSLDVQILLIAIFPASLTRECRSAPTYPGVILAIYTELISPLVFILLIRTSSIFAR